MFEIVGKHNKAKVFTYEVEEKAVAQIQELCNTEWAKDSNIAIMPDVHAGAGCTIGTTMTIKDKVCPNLVGVDIGCGMLTVKLPFVPNQSELEDLDKYIRENIPSGKEVRCVRRPFPKMEKLKCFDELANVDRLYKSLGTLGGGNHFIEISVGSNGGAWLIIHSGSRNLGKQVAEIYQKKAENMLKESLEREKIERDRQIMKMVCLGQQDLIQQELEKFDKEKKANQGNINRTLAPLSGESFDDYLHDMKICQSYAFVNRAMIAEEVLQYLCRGCGEVDGFYVGCRHIVFPVYVEGEYGFVPKWDKYYGFETVHNYIDLDSMILRKGAVSAKKGERLLIPMNMRDGSLMCVGLGNPDWNYSAPHGAGRVMSRGQAMEKITLEEFTASMSGIYSTSVKWSTVDESPTAYKPMGSIVQNIKDTVEIIDVLKPIYNFKAS